MKFTYSTYTYTCVYINIYMSRIGFQIATALNVIFISSKHISYITVVHRITTPFYQKLLSNKLPHSISFYNMAPFY